MLKTAIALGITLATAMAVSAEPVTPQRSVPRTTEAVSFLDGVWIGPAWSVSPSGERTDMTQMERVGPMLGGEIRVMEGKARGANGKTLFNAFTVFSQDEAGGIDMRSYTPGHVGSRKIQLLGRRGFIWEMKAGPHVIRYHAVVGKGEWRETGKLIMANGTERQIFHMTLKRVGDTSWPADNPAFPSR